MRYIESNVGKSADREISLVSERLKSYPRGSEISLSCTFCWCLILFLTTVFQKVVPYFCVLREGYYVIIWPIVRICVFIKD